VIRVLEDGLDYGNLYVSQVVKIKLDPFWIRWPLCGFSWLMLKFDHRYPASKRCSNGCM